MSSSQTYSPFRSVLLREWRRMTSRRLYLCVCIILPLFTLFFMATIFGNGQMENIPIGIVDQDNTASSRAITRNISAVPTFKVTRHFVNEEAARKAVQKKEIYGYLSIPPKFEQDAISGKNATLSLLLSLCVAFGRWRIDGCFRNVAGSRVALSHCDAKLSLSEWNKTRSLHSCCPYKPAITLYTIRVWIIRFI